MGSPFTPRTYRFLRELSANNNRQWFNDGKERYISDVRDPMQQFIILMQEPLRKISKYIAADPRPVGGSMFRIYRDTRFSKDKTPYKTHAACHFRHRNSRDVHTLGFYLHIGPTENILGGGVWRPSTASSNLIRRSIAEKSDQWRQAITAEAFAQHFDGVSGDQLKRVPRDFDPDHPFAHDLRRKDFVASAQLTNKQVTSPDFVPYAAEVFGAMAPLMSFLAGALGLDW